MAMVNFFYTKLLLQIMTIKLGIIAVVTILLGMILIMVALCQTLK